MAPTTSDHHQHSPRRRARGLAVARAEQAPDHHLAGDRDRVEDEREEDEDLKGDLVRGERDRAEARRDRGRQREAGEQRPGSDEQVAARAEQRAQRRQARPPRARRRAQQQPGEGDAHPGLRDDRAEGAAVEAEIEPVDEPQLEPDVGEVRDDQDDQRRAQVARPAQVALARRARPARRAGRSTRSAGSAPPRRPPGPGPPFIACVERVAASASPAPSNDADRERQPQRLRRGLPRLALAARAVLAGHQRGRPVGEEVAEADDHAEDRRREGERRQLDRAEVADDRRVDQQVGRLGGQRPERGQREREDLAVVGRERAFARRESSGGVLRATRRSITESAPPDQRHQPDRDAPDQERRLALDRCRPST